jgi:hypothetical protein
VAKKGVLLGSVIFMFTGRMEALAKKKLPMRIFLAMLLVLLMSGCERDDGANLKAQVHG